MTLKQEATTYEAISDKILKLDSAIISVTVTDPVGESLVIKYLPGVEHLKPADSLMDKAGSLIALLSALVGHAENQYGNCQYIVFAFGKINVALVPIKSEHIIIALGTMPNAPAREICLKVADIFEHTSSSAFH